MFGILYSWFLVLVAYESAEQKPKHCLTWDFLSALLWSEGERKRVIYWPSFAVGGSSITSSGSSSTGPISNRVSASIFALKFPFVVPFSFDFGYFLCFFEKFVGFFFFHYWWSILIVPGSLAPNRPRKFIGGMSGETSGSCCFGFGPSSNFIYFSTAIRCDSDSKLEKRPIWEISCEGKFKIYFGKTLKNRFIIATIRGGGERASFSK